MAENLRNSHDEKTDEVFSNVFARHDEEVPTPPEQDWTEEEEKAIRYSQPSL